MFLSKLFKHTRARVLTALAGLTMVFGTAATISTVAATQQNEVVETKATSTRSDDAIKIHITNYNSGWKVYTLHIWGISYWTTGNHAYGNSDFLDYYIKTECGSAAASKSAVYSSSSKSYYVNGTGNWYLNNGSYSQSGSNYYAEFNLPWWVRSFSYKLVSGSGTEYAQNSDNVWKGGSDTGTDGSATINNAYFYGFGDNWARSSTESSYKYSVLTYVITIHSYKAANTAATATTKTVQQSKWDYLSPADCTSSVPSVAGYSFDSWYSNATLASSWSGGHFTADGHLYAKVVINTYTINYYYVVDGVLQDTQYWNGSTWVSGTPSGSTSATHGTHFYELADPTMYGCSFDGWYSDAACSTGLATTEITSDYAATNCYAKFTSLASSSTFYVGIDGTVEQNKYLLRSWDSGSAGYTWIWYNSSDQSQSNAIKIKELTAISVSNWKYFSFRLPSDIHAAVICKGQWGTDGAYQAQTIDLHPGSGTDSGNDSYANGHNLFIVGSDQSTNAKRKGTWIDIQYYLEVSTNSGFTDGNVTTLTMNPASNASSGNAAEIMSASIPAGSFVRGKYVVNGSSGLNTTYGGDNSTKKYNDNVIHYAVDSGASSVYFHKSTDSGTENQDWYVGSGTYNVYINGTGSIWIVDCAGIDGGGYLYISSDLGASGLKISASNATTSRTYYSNATLSSVDGVGEATALTYGGLKDLIKIPIYNLHGGNGAVGNSLSVTITSAANSSKTTNITGLTVITSETIYLVSLPSGSAWSENTAASTTNASLAELAYDIAKAVENAPNSSVCNVVDDTAASLVATYNTLAATAANRTILEACTIDTYTSTKPTYTGSAAIGLGHIYVQLCAIRGVTPTYPPAGARIVPSVENQSPLTLTLWIVLGTGILGLGAIGTAYFISKKKKHQA